MRLKKVLNKLGPPGLYEAWLLERLVSQPQPDHSKGSVIFAGLSDFYFEGGGKVTASSYLPVFCDELRRNGYETRFVTTVANLKRAIKAANRSIVVMIYREVGHIPNQAGLPEVLETADCVFNHPEIGRLISLKRETNIFLSGRGIAMPQMKQSADGMVFSNAEHASGAETQILEAGDKLDETRYNTDFIDTRFEYGDEAFYTMIRLMCIDRYITHAFVRARDVSEGSASVHSKDIPLDSGLLNAIYDELVVPNFKELEQIATKIASALGPGFYAHDILIEAPSKKIFLCETGYKFDNKSHTERVHPIIKDIPSLKGFEGAAAIAKSSAPSFIKAIEAG